MEKLSVSWQKRYRIIRSGIAYEFVEGDSGEGVPKGLLKAKYAIVLNTSNTPEKRELETFRVVVTSCESDRQTWLQEVNDLIHDKFPRPS